MKKFSFLILLLFSMNSYSKSNSLLKCLGAEEFEYHKKKYTGPLYKLNKTLISHMIQVNKSARLKPGKLDQICEAKSPSLQFLKLLLGKKNIFTLKYSGNVLQDNMAKSSTNDLRKNAPHIFLNFLSYLKSISPSAYCLENQIPEIDELFNNIRYLEKEYSLVNIMHTKNRVSKILNKIQAWESIMKKCYADIKKKSKKKKSPKQ